MSGKEKNSSMEAQVAKNIKFILTAIFILLGISLSAQVQAKQAGQDSTVQTVTTDDGRKVIPESVNFLQ